MSKCISMHGEYSDHVFDNGGAFDSEFTCKRCFAYDEDQADATIADLRRQLAESQERLARVEALRPFGLRVLWDDRVWPNGQSATKDSEPVIYASDLRAALAETEGA